MMTNKHTAYSIGILSTLLYSSGTLADGAFSNSMDDTLFIIDTFTRQLPALIEQTINGAEYSRMVINEWIFFSFIAIVMVASEHTLSSQAVSDGRNVFLTFVAVCLIYVLLQAYIPLLDAFKGWTLGVGTYIQQGLLGKSDPLYPLYYMYEVFTRVKFHWGEPESIFSMVSWFLSNLFMMLLGLVFTALNILMFLLNIVAGLWSIWGFSVMAFIGPLCIPFALFKPLSFIFEGWLKTMLMVLLFGTFTRISISLSVTGYSLLLGVPLIGGFEGEYWTLTLNDFPDLVALIIWSALSIFGIKSSFTFAQALVSGMGGGLSSPGSIKLPSVK